MNNQIEPGVTDNGWVKIIDHDGNIGDNLENNSEYFYLWPASAVSATGTVLFR